MRKWRVGTVSMGLSLVLLGVLLFVSQMKGTQMVEPLLVWWPLILVVLGLEIIVFLFLSKQENPIVKYDFFSILFVGVLGTIGIGLTILTSSGLLTELQTFVQAEDQSINLPEIEEELAATIKRIVLETGSQNVNIEGSPENKLHIFGTYRATVGPKTEPPIKERDDYSLTKVVGNTLYVTIKDPSSHSGAFSTYMTLEPTIVVPDSIQLEVRGEQNTIALYPGSLANHWNVEDAGYVTVGLSKKNNVLLSAISNNNLQDGNVNWDSIETADKGGINENNEKGEADLQNNHYKGTLKLGDGTYQLNIFNSDLISVNLFEEM
ncbi:LiaF transmembrane domain-containing protein [Bacillus sp. DJP31]|uniref:LiaF transmembrane domain-containing protein n=1 Tax=Bacillus sp. DJP31 TaxID=3409789 RepID=UPI003BB48D67